MADVVGGLPSKDRPTPEKHLDIIMSIAREQNKRLDVHVDQENNPFENETEMLARKTIEHGLEGRVSAIHAISVSAKPGNRAGSDRQVAEGRRRQRDRLPVGGAEHEATGNAGPAAQLDRTGAETARRRRARLSRASTTFTTCSCRSSMATCGSNAVC